MPCALPALPAAVSVLVSEPGVAADDSYIPVFGINPSSGDTRETGQMITTLPDCMSH